MQHLQASQDIVNLPGVQRTLQSGKPCIGTPRNLHFGGKNHYGATVNFPILNKNREIKGVVGFFVIFEFIGDEILTRKQSIFKNDYSTLVAQDGTILVHPNSSLVGKTLSEVNSHKSAQVLMQAIMKQETTVVEYWNANGNINYAGTAPFKVGRDSDVYWTSIVIAPEDSIFESVYRLRLIILCSVLVSLLIILITTYFYVKTRIRSRIRNVNSHLHAFFGFLNHERKDAPEPLRIIAQDELGKMGSAINENIEKTKLGLKQDSKMVAQSVETAKIIEAGDFRARITETPRNPQLNELKNVLNHMLDDLQKKIGSDTNEIARVFDSYVSLDFTT
ncbi:HAMP domain-containing protein, partial [Helicobacter trogontum]|uniref:HAMP domain-containing protein n=1 Tax=Helicobacter trogontum TaxID=50960 RepID=UPI002D77B070